MSDSKKSGLTSAEVAERVARGAVNRVRRSDRADYTEIAARNLLTLFNVLVVPAAIALFILGDYRAAIAVSGMAIANAALGIAQEVRAKYHLDRLALLGEATARVVRDGMIAEISSGDVVHGEVVLLVPGDSVVADGTLVEALFLEIDEALLTGESDPVPRRPGERVLSGSIVVAGEGRFIADAVGGDSYIQRTAAEARRYRFSTSPLEESIDRLIRFLTTTAVILCVAYIVPWAVRDFSAKDLVSMIAATITAMVPQGLVLLTTLAFILAAIRMASRGAVVQRLSAVETMAAIDTLCLDKTGTLTTNRLRLAGVSNLSADLSDQEIQRRLRLFASASLDQSNKSIAALRVASSEASGELIDQIPFKSQNRYSAVRVRDKTEVHTLVLGAPEALRPQLDPLSAAQLESSAGELAKTGLRTLLFCDSLNGQPFAGSIEGFALRPLALVALSDELRPEAGAVLGELARHSIKLKILSGDHPETVRATMSSLDVVPELRGLADAPIATGSELEAASDPNELIDSSNVFGRVTPWQKVQIVVALKKSGHHVAMLGDGVNDVLPIKNAHLGIAMGEGARAAKTVSSIVLTTNQFVLLPAILEEGRVLLRNLCRAGKLFLVKNVYMLILIVVALGVFKLPFPFRPQQITLLNFLTIGAPVLLISINTAPSAGPRLRFLREIGGFALITGVLIGAAGVALHWYSAEWRHDDEITQRSLLLTAMVLLGLTNLLRVLHDGRSPRSQSDWRYYMLCLVAVALYLIVLYMPATAHFFELVPLTGDHWLLIAACVAPAAAAAVLCDSIASRLGANAP